jgi:hypothetical protein
MIYRASTGVFSKGRAFTRDNAIDDNKIRVRIRLIFDDGRAEIIIVVQQELAAGRAADVP